MTRGGNLRLLSAKARSGTPSPNSQPPSAALGTPLPKPKVAGSKPVVRFLVCLALALAAGCGGPGGSGSDYTIAYVTPGHGEMTNIVSVDADGNNRHAITQPGPPAASVLAWSPTDPAKMLLGAAGGVWLVESATGGMRRLADGWNPAWSPDGERIAFIGKANVVVLTATGEQLREIAIPVPDFPYNVNFPVSPTLAWSPDGSELAVVADLPGGGPDWTEPSRLYLVPVAGGELTVLVESSDAISRPQWRLGGKSLAYVFENVEGGEPELWTVERDSGEARRLERRISAFAWSPQGERAVSFWKEDEATGEVFIGSKKLWSGAFVYGLTWTPGGQTVALATDDGALLLGTDGGLRGRIRGSARSPSFSADGKEVAFISDGEVVVASIDGYSRRELTDPHTDKFPVWSPDGTKIAFVRIGTEGPGHAVVADADGSDERDVGEGMNPIWTSDGNWLVVTRGPDQGPDHDPPEIWRLRVDAEGERRLAVGHHPTVSRYGTRVAFVRYTSVEIYEEIYTDSSTLFTIGIDGRGLRAIASTKGTEAAHFGQSVWLPGDEELAVYASSIGGSELARVSLDGRKRVVSALAEANDFDFSADGRRLAYLQDYPREELVITREGAEPIRVRPPEVGQSFNGPLRWSPDDRKLAFMVFSNVTEQDEIFVVDADGSGLKSIAVANRFDGGPAWRPSKVP